MPGHMMNSMLEATSSLTIYGQAVSVLRKSWLSTATAALLSYGHSSGYSRQEPPSLFWIPLSQLYVSLTIYAYWSRGAGFSLKLLVLFQMLWQTFCLLSHFAVAWSFHHVQAL